MTNQSVWVCAVGWCLGWWWLCERVGWWWLWGWVGWGWGARRSQGVSNVKTKYRLFALLMQTVLSNC